jgi:hypothetical protein
MPAGENRLLHQVRTFRLIHCAEVPVDNEPQLVS